MSNANIPTRSLKEWMELITECRQSGPSDAAWCRQHKISVSSFYNAATRLRRKACTIPEPVDKPTTTKLDLTSNHQDVVKIDVQPERFQSDVVRTMESSMHLDNSHTIELKMDDVSIKLSNLADPFLLQQIIRMLRPIQC